jgi:hypothetical protein
MHLGLAVAADPDQLRPVPDQFPQLTCFRRGDPRLRESAHPQQIGEILGVAFVVLDPPILEGFHPQRMSQMHVGAGRLEGIDRPVPAVGRLEDDLRVDPGTRHHPIQRIDIIGDPDRLQHLTGIGRPNQHRAAPMQIDTHELLTCILRHKGPPSS